VLRAQTTASWVVSVAPENRFGVDLRQRRVLVPTGRPNLAVVAMAAVERLGQVSHVFNALDGWLFLRALGGRTVLYTVTTAGEPTPRDRELLARVSLFVAETEPLAGTLAAAGVEPSRIRVVYPGVDLDAFEPAPPVSDGPFTVVFASTPADARDIDRRGIPLLADVARRMPDVRFTMLWRRWGHQADARGALEGLALPANVIVRWGDVADMAHEYRRAHATVACFALGGGKSAPNSVIEGLACGRPTVVTDTVGLAPLVARTGAGVVTARDADALADGVEHLRRRYEAYARRARPVAEEWFDVRRFSTDYARFYRALADRRTPAGQWLRDGLHHSS